MDSGNSGSMSSSGGDEEYDSRAESISAFLNPSSHVGSLSNHPPHQASPPPHHHHHQETHSSSMFDPLSNYFDPRSVHLTNPNSLLNLDMVWPKTLRSDSNAADLGGLITPASSSSPQNQPFLTNQLGGQSRPGGFPNIQIPPAPENAPPAQPGNNNSNAVRNPKKRSRASRRAPTTVLTTDTTNFRAMVQEFTGIPAPPFTSSALPRSRLDLFGSASSSLRSGHLDPPPPPYLLRPFAQKIQPPPPTSSSSSAPPPMTSFHSSSMVDVLGFLKQPPPPQNLLNMQNPILNLQTLLQAQPKFSLSGSKPQAQAQASSEIPPNVLEEFALSRTQMMSSTTTGGLPNMVSSNENNWGGGDGGGDQGLLRSLNGSYSSSERVVNNGKMNYSAASSSDFHGDKGPENVASRSEGMVESWICSSD
ncbi:extensin-like [Corylus avellana]|uniref:extensin-like n=1 Tax=Corylus avellana TaxID=13451 RepID=UPI00286D0CF3|nr:extensin-like [Corylus avellana]